MTQITKAVLLAAGFDNRLHPVTAGGRTRADAASGHERPTPRCHAPPDRLPRLRHAPRATHAHRLAREAHEPTLGADRREVRGERALQVDERCAHRAVPGRQGEDSRGCPRDLKAARTARPTRAPGSPPESCRPPGAPADLDRHESQYRRKANRAAAARAYREVALNIPSRSGTQPRAVSGSGVAALADPSCATVGGVPVALLLAARPADHWPGAGAARRPGGAVELSGRRPRRARAAAPAGVGLRFRRRGRCSRTAAGMRFGAVDSDLADLRADLAATGQRRRRQVPAAWDTPWCL